MDNKFRKALKLFLVFFKIGAFTFGGGYAMIPLIQKEACDKKKWISEQDIFEIIAIAESTPGPIAINSATFIGYKVAGIRTFFETFGLFCVEIILICCLQTKKLNLILLSHDIDASKALFAQSDPHGFLFP